LTQSDEKDSERKPARGGSRRGRAATRRARPAAPEASSADAPEVPQLDAAAVEAKRDWLRRKFH
jgi:hypothetical protein